MLAYVLQCMVPVPDSLYTSTVPSSEHRQQGHPVQRVVSLTIHCNVLLTVACSALVAEVMLFSEGFEDSKVLSRKMVQLYKLASEQLSQQVRHSTTWNMYAE